MDFVFPPRAGLFLLAWSRAGPICRCGARGLVGRLLRFDSSVAARALNRRGWLCSARRIVRASCRGSPNGPTASSAS